MNAEQFCLENGNETLSGRITFSKRAVSNFLKIYTYLSIEDLGEEQLQKLKFFMVDLQSNAYKDYHRNDLPAEKIELPKFIFE